MIVTAWHDGHGTYGVRVANEDIGLWFRPEWKWVTIQLKEEKEPASVPLTPSFWTSSPELRSPRLKAFFERLELIPWVKNRPPAFELEPLGAGVFRLRLLKNIIVEENQPGQNPSLLDIRGTNEGEADDSGD